MIDLTVSIHAPARGATIFFFFLRLNSKFQSTRPRGARHKDSSCRSKAERFQSTRPRGARPPEHTIKLTLMIVSIHAPARGATRRRAYWVTP